MNRSDVALAQIDVHELNQRLKGASSVVILKWVWSTFGDRAAATSSFQTQSVPLLHLIAQTTPEMPVLFLNTGFHFPETLEFRDRLEDEFGLHVCSLEPRLGHDGFQERHGDLHRRDPDLCCHLNKVQPLNDALEDYNVWVAGIRRDQTEARTETPVIQWRDEDTLKVCPMVEWTSKDVWTYINEYDLPAHPLFQEGYYSIGCAPCTQPPGQNGDARDGRWAGKNKTECGLHVDNEGDAERNNRETEVANETDGDGGDTADASLGS
jgi:phosphoadenosine phosphosulfate reductase